MRTNLPPEFASLEFRRRQTLSPHWATCVRNMALVATHIKPQMAGCNSITDRIDSPFRCAGLRQQQEAKYAQSDQPDGIPTPENTVIRSEGHNFRVLR